MIAGSSSCLLVGLGAVVFMVCVYVWFRWFVGLVCFGVLFTVLVV